MSDFQSLTIAGVNETSITLQWNGSLPEMTGSPQRNIRQYVVTISSQDGGDRQVVLIPPETLGVHTITGLQSTTTYYVVINVIIDTDGQGERTYDLGIPSLTVTTRKHSKLYSVNIVLGP